MLIFNNNEVFILLPKQMSVLDPFFNNVKDEYKCFLADKDEHGNYIIKPPMPLETESINQLTKNFEEVTANRLVVKQVANFVISFIPLAIAFISLYNLKPLFFAIAIGTIFTMSFTMFALLSIKLSKWHESQIRAIEAVKQYIYIAFNVAAVEDIQKATEIIKKHELSLREMDQNFKTVKEINDIIRKRYTDLTQRVSKNMLQEHMAFCKVRHPALDEYEVVNTNQYH